MRRETAWYQEECAAPLIVIYMHHTGASGMLKGWQPGAKRLDELLRIRASEVEVLSYGPVTR